MQIERIQNVTRDEYQVLETIKTDQIPLYEKAAELTGYKVTVTAQEGENFTFWIDHFRLGRTVIRPGYVGVSIESPVGQRNYHPFWETYKALKAASTDQNP